MLPTVCCCFINSVEYQSTHDVHVQPGQDCVERLYQHAPPCIDSPQQDSTDHEGDNYDMHLCIVNVYSSVHDFDANASVQILEGASITITTYFKEQQTKFLGGHTKS